MVQFADDTRVVEVRTKNLQVGDVVQTSSDDENDWRVLLFKRANSITGVFTCGFGNAEGNRSVCFWQPEDHHLVVIKVQPS